MKGRQSIIIAGIAIASFAATVLILLDRHRLGAPEMATVSAPAKSLWKSITAPLAEASHPASSAQVVAAGESKAASAEAAIEVPPADENGPPLPVMMAVDSHPAVHVADEEGASEQTVDRAVHVQNTSGELLAITVMAVSSSDGKRTLAQLLVPPNQQASVGSESGLKLEPGYTVALRSPGHREMTAIVE